MLSIDKSPLQNHDGLVEPVRRDGRKALLQGDRRRLQDDLVCPHDARGTLHQELCEADGAGHALLLKIERHSAPLPVLLDGKEERRGQVPVRSVSGDGVDQWLHLTTQLAP